MSTAAALRADATYENNDPRYAWVMLPLAMMMQIGTSPGQTFGVSVFKEQIRQSLGLSETQLATAYLVASLLAAVPLMTIGRRMDRHGLRLVSIALVTMVGVACMVVASATSLLAITIGFLMLRTFGQGGLSMAAGNTLGMWFNRRLGLASGIAGVGMSGAIAVMPMAYLYLIHSVGWRTAYTAIGLGTIAVLLPALLLFYRNSPAVDDDETTEASSAQLAAMGLAPAPSFTLREAMRTPAYWIASICTALMGMICTAVIFNLVTIFERHGMTATQAASIFPVMAIAMAMMQVNGGLLADRLPLRWLLAAAMAALAGGITFMGNVDSMLMAQIGAAMLGWGQGMMAVTGNTLWPRFFGRRHLGSIRSSVWTATVASCSIGPFIMGATMDLTGSYAPAIWLFVSLLAVAAVAAAIAAKRPVVSQDVDLAEQDNVEQPCEAVADVA
ncbi:MFS transporter [Aeoliella sp. ICT_H6.2]|uniref:MFS transporter n=1 Tax=Aeoliella straminimaris TaxID=2954799 RepID=A0A9X2FJ42_9BACT|nr:MFS transporter [Aeoliella straminimaris]MCO6047826.1 MFS transporter [Aeoliella straminimaris]